MFWLMYFSVAKESLIPRILMEGGFSLWISDIGILKTRLVGIVETYIGRDNLLFFRHFECLLLEVSSDESR